MTDTICPPERPRGYPFDELLAPAEGQLFVFSGPSGVGKDAVLSRLREEHFPVTWIVTATTRQPRPNERDGVNYQFLTAEQFDQWRRDGKLLEWAEVYGNFYGTPIDAVRQAVRDGNDVILKIDVQGAAQVKRRLPNAIFIFLAPSSLHELEVRIRSRNTEPPDVLQRRLDEALAEIKQIPNYDYVIVNRQDQLDCAVDHLKAIIVSERLKVHRRSLGL